MAAVRRIKAPNVDNSMLIKDNALTLIGRLTNPQEQKMWALIPALPRKWNLKGKVTGSDLGNNCFQFRFELEEDLRRVLDNRPYHFAYWMVILQRWEPVISNTFPSTIPFWIRIKGLPLHFWHDDMVVRVGQDLGTLENHELTKTTARVRVHIDGLKPLIKEAIVEFDSGEESLITLEYEKLELHCLLCASLLHTRRNCPLRADQESRSPQNSRSSPEVRLLTFTDTKAHKDDNKTLVEKDHDSYQFKARVDRHGNPFGDRVSTKQTRIPPPVNATRGREADSQNWRSTPAREDTNYSSPPYTQNRQISVRVPQRAKDLFPQRTQEVWRPKLVPAPEDPTNHAQKLRLKANQNIIITQQTEEMGAQTREEILEDLHHVTRQYLSCSDPVEAAARKQRVMLSDARGDMDTTVAAIMAGDTSRRQLPLQPSGMGSNPVTPPPIQSYPFQEPLLPEPPSLYSPQIREEEDAADEVQYNDADLTPKATKGGSAKLKSIIISPSSPQVEEQQTLQETIQATDKEETLQEFQNKVKRNAKRSQQGRSPRASPNILRGASSKKRKLSQLQNSPARGGEPSRGNMAGKKDKPTAKKNAGASQQTTNPPIRLIPAVTKKKSDFRVPPPRAP